MNEVTRSCIIVDSKTILFEYTNISTQMSMGHHQSDYKVQNVQFKYQNTGNTCDCNLLYFTLMHTPDGALAHFVLTFFRQRSLFFAYFSAVAIGSPVSSFIRSVHLFGGLPSFSFRYEVIFKDLLNKDYCQGSGRYVQTKLVFSS